MQSLELAEQAAAALHDAIVATRHRSAAATNIPIADVEAALALVASAEALTAALHAHASAMSAAAAEDNNAESSVDIGDDAALYTDTPFLSSIEDAATASDDATNLRNSSPHCSTGPSGVQSMMPDHVDAAPTQQEPVTVDVAPVIGRRPMVPWCQNGASIAAADAAAPIARDSALARARAAKVATPIARDSALARARAAKVADC